MGREIRRVPPNWEHPKRMVPNHRLGRMEEGFQPMRDKDYDTAMKEWLEELNSWLAGGLEQCIVRNPDLKYSVDAPYSAFAKWHGQPPDLEYYRPAWNEEPTWLQMYETVSEGTPVSPAFSTPEELIDYLVAHGDFWDQKRRAEGRSSMPCEPWERKHAEAFVRNGWAPSMIVDRATGTIKEPRDSE